MCRDGIVITYDHNVCLGNIEWSPFQTNCFPYFVDYTVHRPLTSLGTMRVFLSRRILPQHLNHGSSRSSLGRALLDGSNFSSRPTSRETRVISCFVNSGRLPSSKYTSSSHCWSVQGSSSTGSRFIACHFSRHRLGISSVQNCSICETTEVGVAMMESKGGWPATSSKSFAGVRFHSIARAKKLGEKNAYQAAKTPQVHAVIDLVAKYSLWSPYC